ncbi:MAG: TetR/AcrR family transcriptional regulator [Patulibacter sp.]|nr:TetR/AcrR family transcriptional regulator [Patulibacter sp.]
MDTPRLTRKEQQERTRDALIRAGARAVAERGLHRASIDEIARDAGFTKGAFYANFASKDALVLAILERHFSTAIDDVDDAVASHDAVEDQARDAGLKFADQMASDPAWGRVFVELVGHATRDEDFRREMLARITPLRDRVAAVYAQRAEELGLESAHPPDEIARMTSTMASGVAIQRLIDPDGVPDDLFGTMLVLFFAGLQATAGPREPAP